MDILLPDVHTGAGIRHNAMKEHTMNIISKGTWLQNSEMEVDSI